MQKSSERAFGWGTGVAFVGVFGTWLFSPWFLRWLHGDYQGAGSFGDSFGALTSLFTGLAFVGLIVTLRQQKRQIEMQREDLKLQREEMKASREELAGQKAQMELQNQSLRQQMFEQTFFNLLNLFNQYIDDLVQDNPRSGKEPKAGRDQLQHILWDLTRASRRVATGKKTSNALGGMTNEHRERTEIEFVEAIAQRVLSKYGQFANDLNSYFRLLYNILKLVNQAEVEDKKTYTNILRAQLSDSELQLIALNCARSQGAKLKVLVDEYQILKHLPTDLFDLSIEDVRDEIAKLEAAGE
jgi:hypothetical protein